MFSASAHVAPSPPLPVYDVLPILSGALRGLAPPGQQWKLPGRANLADYRSVAIRSTSEMALALVPNFALSCH
jgi:hypothetical protein